MKNEVVEAPPVKVNYSEMQKAFCVFCHEVKEERKCDYCGCDNISMKEAKQRKLVKEIDEDYL